MKYAPVRPNEVGLSTDLRDPGHSVIRTSKTWVLPAKTKPGRRPGTAKREDSRPTESREDPRKVRNREAQRAFRERQAGQIKILREEVEKWRRRYQDMKMEVQNRDRDIELLKASNERLLKQIEAVELKSKATELTKCKSCFHGGYNAGIVSNFADPKLQEQIDKFQPMEAVPLSVGRKKRKGGSPSSLPTFKKGRVEAKELGLSPGESIVKETIQLGVAEQGCGFCSESSTCLCKEFDTRDLTSDPNRTL